MPSRQDIESAKLRMLTTRQALEDYENAKGCMTSSKHQKLSSEFRKATKLYLKLTETQR